MRENYTSLSTCLLLASLPLVEPIGGQRARELVMQSMEVSLPRLRSRAENGCGCVCVRVCVCVCVNKQHIKLSPLHQIGTSTFVLSPPSEPLENALMWLSLYLISSFVLLLIHCYLIYCVLCIFSLIATVNKLGVGCYFLWLCFPLWLNQCCEY